MKIELPKVDKGIPISYRKRKDQRNLLKSPWPAFLKTLEIGDSFVLFYPTVYSVMAHARILGINLEKDDLPKEEGDRMAKARIWRVAGEPESVSALRVLRDRARSLCEKLQGLPLAGWTEEYINLKEEIKRTERVVPPIGLRTTMQDDTLIQSNDLAATVKEYGFESEQDFHNHVAGADISTPERVAAFKKWQHEDGSKAGLLKLPKRPL